MPEGFMMQGGGARGGDPMMRQDPIGQGQAHPYSSSICQELARITGASLTCSKGSVPVI